MLWKQICKGVKLGIKDQNLEYKLVRLLTSTADKRHSVD